MRKLTALKIKALVEPGRYSDGDGLFLEINGKGAGSWILRVQANGRRRDIGLGSLKAVSLSLEEWNSGEGSGSSTRSRRSRQTRIVSASS